MSRSTISLRLLLVVAALTTTALGQGVTAETQADRELRAAVQEVVGELDPIIVTATRTDERAFDTPFSTAFVGADRTRRARTLQDALRDLPAIHIQRTSYGQSSPYLRGFTGYHTVMLIDGVRLNNSVLRSGPNEYWGLVDGLSLDHIEAVFGPGSVLYGSDAVGGTINAIPLRRTQYGPEDSWDRRVYLRFSSAESMSPPSPGFKEVTRASHS